MSPFSSLTVPKMQNMQQWQVGPLGAQVDYLQTYQQPASSTHHPATQNDFP